MFSSFVFCSLVRDIEEPQLMVAFKKKNQILIEESKDVKLQCNATGVPGPTIKWYLVSCCNFFLTDAQKHGFFALQTDTNVVLFDTRAFFFCMVKTGFCAVT